MTYTGDSGNNDVFAAVVTPAAAGVYTYGVRFDGNRGVGNPNAAWTNGDRTGLLTVEPPCAPVTNTLFAWTPITPTVGDVVTFTASAEGSGPIVYTWDIDGDIKTGAVVTYAFDMADSYTVVLTATNDCGEQVVTHDVTVVAACMPVTNTLFAWTPITPTVGAVVTFTASAEGSGLIAYAWDVDGVGKTGATFTYTFAATGTYTVILTATNDCGEQVVTHDVTVKAAKPPEYKLYLPLVMKNAQ
jgi:PKD repeat protein